MQKNVQGMLIIIIKTNKHRWHDYPNIINKDENNKDRWLNYANWNKTKKNQNEIRCARYHEQIIYSIYVLNKINVLYKHNIELILDTKKMWTITIISTKDRICKQHGLFS